MRLAYGILILSLSGLGGAVAVTGQQAPLAEQQFKNIKSFKGDKASDVIPAMQFMSASLKVDCDYCHTADRASDDLEPKRAAREMIAMQREINKTHFNGRNQITCATCHGGKIRPVGVPPITGLEVRARRAATVVADDVLANYGKAMGADAASKVAGLHLEGMSESGAVKSKVEATYSGSKFTFTTKGAKADNKMGFNGTMAWFTTEKGIQAVPLQYAVHYVNEKTLFVGLDSLPKLTNTSGGTAKIEGKDNVVVTGTGPDRTRVSLYFDKTTGLLSRSSFSYPTILGSMTQINDYTNYKKVNGVPLPMKIVNHASEGDTTIEYKSVKVDNKIDPISFDPPKS